MQSSRIGVADDPRNHRRRQVAGWTGWALAAALPLVAGPALAGPATLDLTITPSAPTVTEGGTVMVDVSAQDCFSPANDVTYSVSAIPLTAAAVDFDPPVPSTITIGVSGFTAAVSVSTVDDTAVEPSETFELRVEPLPGQTLDCVEPGPLTPTTATAIVTILDNDIPSISIDDITVTEGDVDTTSATFTITASGTSQGPISVFFETAPGSAQAGTDFLPTSGTVPFPAGALSTTVTVAVVGDTEVEPDETFFVNLSAAVGATLGDPQGQATILDDDEPPPPDLTLSIDDVTIAEGDSGTQQAVFTVTLSDLPEETVTVAFETADGTATEGVDYQQTRGTLGFGAGQAITAVTFAVPILGDTEVEPDETFFVRLSNAVGAAIVRPQGQGTIVNDDEEPPPPPPPTELPTLSIDDVSVTEGDEGTTAATFTVRLSETTDETVSVSFATADDTATAGSDYQSTSGTVGLSAGQTEVTLTVPVLGDTEAESDETFFVDLSDPVGATLADPRGVGTITNDDEEPPPPPPAAQPTVSVGDLSVTEGDSGVMSALFTVSLSEPTTEAVTVAFSTSNGSAIGGSDYQSTNGEVTFSAGQTAVAVEVPVVGDTNVEPDETFFLDLGAAALASGAVLAIADGRGQATIVNDDAEVPLQIERGTPETVNARDGEVIAVAVTATRGGAPAAGVPVGWAIEGDGVLLDGDTTLSGPDGVASQRARLGESGATVVITATLPDEAGTVDFQIAPEPPLVTLFDEGEAGGTVAGVLDDACDAAQGELAAFCDYLFEIDDPAQRRQVVEALVPDQVAALDTVAKESSQVQLRQLFDRMRQLRRRPATSRASRNDVAVSLEGLNAGVIRSAMAGHRDTRQLAKAIDAALAAAGASTLGVDEAPRPGEGAADEGFDELPRWGFFASGSIADGDRSDSQSEAGFDFESSGLTAGVDYALGERWVLGAALGYLNNESEFSATGSRLEVEGWSVSTYLSYFREVFYVDAVASWGGNRYELGRSITLPVAFQGQTRFGVTGRPDGDQLALGLGVGGDHSFGALSVGEFARLSWVESSIDGYSESGSGAFALELAEQELESLLLEVGLELTRASSFSWGVLQPQLRFSFLRELEDDARLIRARFVQDGNFTDFLVPTESPDREFFNVAAGLTATFARGRTFYLLYDRDLSRDDLEVGTFSAGLRLELR